MSAARTAPGAPALLGGHAWCRWSGERAAAECRALADLTARAYAGSDPRAGLPVPDGARERPADVRRHVRKGGTYVVLPEGDGGIAAAAAVVALEDALEVRRVVVPQHRRGSGALAAVLDAVAGCAAAEGLRAVVLDAVVERCLPTVYVRHRFVPRRWWRPSDKPLSEIRMERPVPPYEGVAGPEPPAAGPGTPTVLVWTPAPGGRMRAHRLADVDADTSVAGLDLLPAHRGDPAAGDAVREDDPAFLMPRRVDDGALALWRAAPGRDRPLGLLAGLLPPALLPPPPPDPTGAPP